MATAAGDSHPYPVYGANYRVVFPLLDADGDLVTGASTPDSEVSKDCGTFADCTNEMTEIATSSGMYYLDLTGAEMTAKVVSVIAKSATAGMKTTPLVLYPIRLPVLVSGTAQAGAASTITLASGASAADNYYAGLFVLITNNTPSGAQYQLRRIVSYVGSTKVATVDSAWGTNPSSASTYDLLIPEGYATAVWAGAGLADPHTAGYPVATVKDGTGTGEIDTTSGGVLVAALASGAITATSIAADAIGASELAADAATEIATAVWASATRTLTALGFTLGASDLASDTITAAKIAADAIDADALKTDAITEIVTAILTTAMTEAYNADGSPPTLAQALFLIMQVLTEFAISGTTLTVNKLDGTTEAATFTLDSSTSPTSLTRAS